EGSGAPSAAAISAASPSATEGESGSDGIDMTWRLSRPRSTVSVPDRVSKATLFSSGARRSNSSQALASVAWPQSSTSASGVNQRSRYLPAASFTKNAVSARLFSSAIFCMSPSSSHDSSGTIAAGLPPNGLSEKASTCHIFKFIAHLSGWTRTLLAAAVPRECTPAHRGYAPGKRGDPCQGLYNFNAL